MHDGPENATPTEWLRSGNLLYTLQQNRWNKGEPNMINHLMVRVEVWKGTPFEVEQLMQNLHRFLNEAKS